MGAAQRTLIALGGVDVFEDHLVRFERTEGTRRIVVHRLSDGDEHVIEQPEEVSTASGGANPEFSSHVLRYGYTSMVTPSSDTSGRPHRRSSSTQRDLGPSVTRTASASIAAPRRTRSRASALNRICLAAIRNVS